MARSVLPNVECISDNFHAEFYVDKLAPQSKTQILLGKQIELAYKNHRVGFLSTETVYQSEDEGLRCRYGEKGELIAFSLKTDLSLYVTENERVELVMSVLKELGINEADRYELLYAKTSENSCTVELRKNINGFENYVSASLSESRLLLTLTPQHYNTPNTEHSRDDIDAVVEIFLENNVAYEDYIYDVKASEAFVSELDGEICFVYQIFGQRTPDSCCDSFCVIVIPK
jgi:hypothetical protein